MEGEPDKRVKILVLKMFVFCVNLTERAIGERELRERKRERKKNVPFMKRDERWDIEVESSEKEGMAGRNDKATERREEAARVVEEEAAEAESEEEAAESDVFVEGVVEGTDGGGSWSCCFFVSFSCTRLSSFNLNTWMVLEEEATHSRVERGEKDRELMAAA